MLSQQPHGHGALLLALEEQLKPPEILIVRGSSRQLAEWQSGQQRSYRPASMVLAIPDDADVPQALADKKPRPGGVIYRCRGTQCETPEPME